MTARLAPGGSTVPAAGPITPATTATPTTDGAAEHATAAAGERHDGADGNVAPIGGGPTTSWAHVALVVTVLSAVLAVVVLAFAWPASRSAVHDVPIAVAGPAPAVTQVTERLEANRPGAFDVTTLPDATAARAAIEDRDVYGAVVVGPDGASVLTASAASPAVAQALGEVARGLAAAEQGGPAVTITDVVKPAADDPRGAGLGSAALPLVLAGLAGAAVLSLRVSGTGRRIAAALGLAVVAGAAITAVLQPWLGILDGSFPANAGVVALGIAAVVLPILGLVALLGPAGIGIGAAVMMLLGNPLSGAATAPEMLPAGWGALGQLLPPGATGSLLRSVAFFDGAAAGGPLAVLGTWAVAGLLLMALGRLRHPRAH
jgi:hypothetical protein